MESWSYFVLCPHCGESSDATIAEFCNCAGDPSLECSSCGLCSCARIGDGSIGARLQLSDFRHPEATAAALLPGALRGGCVTHLLLISNDSGSLESTAHLLEQLGFRLGERRSGAVAMNSMEEKPRMTGHQIYGIIRRGLGARCPVLVALTVENDSTEKQVEVFSSEGVDTYSVEEMAAKAAGRFFRTSMMRSPSEYEH